ncbi:hypothetical protein MKEN_01294100 [Mycena kentingensis (nom. inval.)]|nr:hypothetical protein MKEN_01294100 [Mycena kentingensis (nom. inval.)]
MSRRPSTLSIRPIPNGSVNVLQSPADPLRASVTKIPSALEPSIELDPDVLFSKHTIAEVKFAKEKLRADADAKQEELRLMVGERYRDLLQASTSIVSISRSSGRVISALREAKDAILSQDATPIPQRASTYGGGDAHLHALQILAAHIKLLLDAPEYLWRLIERQKYFTAAWLYLLAGVVQRALVRDNDQEESWRMEGIDVMEQFPLVQRQWDAVGQFRTQIAHKATTSLRESATTSADVCGALLTLYLLDSLPLIGTFSRFLDERSKTMTSLLLRSSDTTSISPLSPSPSRQTNGFTFDRRAPVASRKGALREVREATQTALNAMTQTLAASRDVFEETGSKSSMIRSVLECMQSESVDSVALKALPAELQLTTQTLLATLPSSTHLLLLPPNLRSYRPYVDLTSATTFVDQAHFGRLLQNWFRSTSESLQSAVSKWFGELQSVSEVWSLRATIREWISASNLRPNEIERLLHIFDEVAQDRVLGIWRLELNDAEDAFESQLASASTSLRESSTERRQDVSPVDFLFSAPPLPTLSGVAAGDSSFQKYRAALCRQLVGRTALLDSVLATLENCAKALQRDIAVISSGDDDSRVIVAKLSEKYQPDADELCRSVTRTLSATEKPEMDDDELFIERLIFVAHVADELVSSSTFINDINSSPSAAQDFKKATKALHDRIIDRWRKTTVSRLITRHRDSCYPPPTTLLSTPSAPSSALFESLSTLATSLQELGLSREQQNHEANNVLRLFIVEWIGDDWKQHGAQALCDIAFLRRLAQLRAAGWEDVCELLDAKAEKLHEPVGSVVTVNGWNDKSGEQLARTQTILAALLPAESPMRAEPTDKTSALLPFGAPTEQAFEALLEFGDQSTRFGMLLVDVV